MQKLNLGLLTPLIRNLIATGKGIRKNLTNMAALDT